MLSVCMCVMLVEWKTFENEDGAFKIFLLHVLIIINEFICRQLSEFLNCANSFYSVLLLIIL